jgi:glycine/D-amino acid oxidase-like deaminating enzyme
VAIVGAGISGAFMAYELSRHYRDVVVLDRRGPATGSTHASTAMLQFEIDTPLTALCDQIGVRKAERAWRMSYLATQRLVRLVQQEQIACDLERRDSLYLTGGSLGWRGMKQEAMARNRAGLTCEYLTGKTLAARFGVARTGAIHSARSAIADPVALTLGLLHKARRRGARVFVSVDVRDVMSTKHGVMLDAGAHFVEARHAVFCTGYEVIPGLMRPGSKITSSWAAATAPGTAYPEWLNHTLVWEAAEPYLYMRTDGKGRLIVGGEDANMDSPVYRAETLTAKARRLGVKTKQLLNIAPEWKHVWAGAFGESVDGLPTIGEVPGLKRCFAVMGFGGNGTIYALIAAQMMPALLKGRVSAGARLFAFR